MGNVTTSVLKLTPREGDHGKSLVCRAENPRLEGSAIEDNWKLAVFCECLCVFFSLSLITFAFVMIGHRFFYHIFFLSTSS